PIVAVNPDPGRYDGILLRFRPDQAGAGVTRALEDNVCYHHITMAEVRLNDGQNLLAFNDFLVGQKTHVSARYSLRWHGQTEEQLPSGVLVPPGAGSPGWLSSMQNMACSVAKLLHPAANTSVVARSPEHATAPTDGLRGGTQETFGRRSDKVGRPCHNLRLSWDDPRLVFVVREPFRTRITGINLTAGFLDPGQELQIESHMPEGGVIFSDGIENDCLAFNSGSVAVIRAAKQQTRLVAA